MNIPKRLGEVATGAAMLATGSLLLASTDCRKQTAVATDIVNTVKREVRTVQTECADLDKKPGVQKFGPTKTKFAGKLGVEYDTEVKRVLGNEECVIRVTKDGKGYEIQHTFMQTNGTVGNNIWFAVGLDRDSFIAEQDETSHSVPLTFSVTKVVEKDSCRMESLELVDPQTVNHCKSEITDEFVSTKNMYNSWVGIATPPV